MNRIFTFILIICIPCANAAQDIHLQFFVTENNTPTLEAEIIDFVQPKNEDAIRQDIVSQGKKVIGTPYHWGGTSIKGFDCSGLIYSTLR